MQKRFNQPIFVVIAIGLHACRTSRLWQVHGSSNLYRVYLCELIVANSDISGYICLEYLVVWQCVRDKNRNMYI